MATDGGEQKKAWRQPAAAAQSTCSGASAQAPRRELPAPNPALKRGTARGLPRISHSGGSTGPPASLPSGRHGDEASLRLFPQDGGDAGVLSAGHALRVFRVGPPPFSPAGVETGASRPHAPANKKSGGGVTPTFARLVGLRSDHFRAAAGRSGGRNIAHTTPHKRMGGARGSAP